MHRTITVIENGDGFSRLYSCWLWRHSPAAGATNVKVLFAKLSFFEPFRQRLRTTVQCSEPMLELHGDLVGVHARGLRVVHQRGGLRGDLVGDSALSYLPGAVCRKIR